MLHVFPWCYSLNWSKDGLVAIRLWTMEPWNTMQQFDLCICLLRAMWQEVN